MPGRALISVTDKTGVVPFARALVARGYELVSTGGTAKLLAAEGLAVTPIDAVTGFPEILDGRVKTLHPKVHGGILARRDLGAHRDALKAHGITPIDVVAVNLYPFQATVARPDHTLAEAIENIDIGGPSMIRSAAKNHAHVLVVVDPADYERVIAALPEPPAALRYELAARAFAHTAAYDAAISSYLLGRDETGRPREELPELLTLSWQRKQALRYGENPHQRAAFYVDPRPPQASVATAEQLHGKELSFNNILDLDAAWRLVASFEDPAAAVIKHTNPCGFARQAPGARAALAEIYRTARACDSLSAFGGVVALNRVVDEATAEVIKETFIEAVIAPDFDDAARALLEKKANLRLLRTGGMPAAERRLDLRRVDGGVLVQDADSDVATVRAARVVTKRAPTEAEWASLELGWKVCRHVKSNAIVYALPDRVVGVGAGQMSRVDSSKIAGMKAGAAARGSAVASDAFFPFPDGVEAAAEAGATAVIQPGGSVRDDEVIATADQLGVAMVFTGVRHFRH